MNNAPYNIRRNSMIDIEKIKQRRIAEALQKRRDDRAAEKKRKEEVRADELALYTRRVVTCIEQKKNCPTLRQTWET
jgi:hypothetical protein